MLEFDEEKARNMSQEEVMSIICEGLAEFADSMAEQQPKKKRISKKKVAVRERCPTCRKYRTVYKKEKNLRKEYEKQAKTFRSFSKIFSASKGVKNGKS